MEHLDEKQLETTAALLRNDRHFRHLAEQAELEIIRRKLEKCDDYELAEDKSYSPFEDPIVYHESFA